MKNSKTCFFSVILISTIMVGAVHAVDVHAEQVSRPNVILCMADDLGWGCVGYNGHKVIKTPHLDTMSQEGVRFDRFYAAAPVCSPTRASCLTGRHPYRTGVFSANTGILRPEEITLAEVLKPQGYATGHFGKWHLGTFTTTEKDANRGGDKHPEFLNPPSEHGFDVYFSTESKVPTWDPMMKPASFLKEESLKFGWNHLTPNEASEPYGTYYWTAQGKAAENLKGDDSRIIMDRAIGFIENAAKKEQPFLAVIWFHAPHLPCVAGPEYAAMYKDQDFKMQQYAGCITAIDDQMGRLRNKLNKLGINNNTMLFFTSDNGPENGTPGDAGQYRARKRSLYEGGVRVPGLMTWPNKIKTPMTTNVPVVTSDYLPTVIDVLGIDLPAHTLDGTSILPLLECRPFKRPTPIGFASSGQKTFNGHKYKLYTKGNKTELYDMETDPYERLNIAAKLPKIVETFQAGFADWYDACKDSFEGEEYGTASLEKVKQKWPNK
jgi:arylsulfatase A-like enzyme